MQEATKAPVRPSRGRSPARGNSPPRVDAHELLGASRQVTINHAGADYTLRITRNGKLILTK
jgi:hemin uptake protein HemP